MARYHSIDDILSVARSHPFYNHASRYPPNLDAISRILEHGDGGNKVQLSGQSLLQKEQLYKIVDRLCADESAENEFRRSSYISITGGGSGKSLPMLFLTDVQDNENQRAAMSQLMKDCKLVELSDWVLNLHPSGFFYRALDLSTQNIEQAGGSVLCAGHMMPHEKSVAMCIKYRVNVITADTSHILNFAHYVASLPSSTRNNFRITKIIYSCELMSKTKREYLCSVFGPVTFYSMYASAETGPWAVANFDWTGQPIDESATDLIFDSRAMKVEVLQLSSKSLASITGSPPEESEMAPEGTLGHLVLTSLQRLKNPLVRYVSGDIGSVHPLPELNDAQIDPGLQKHLRVLRLYGRDQRFSFKWLAEYYELDKLDRVMQTKQWGILQWQVIIENGKDWEGSDTLELRLMRCSPNESVLDDEQLKVRLRETFYLTTLTEELFRAVFVDDVQGFERSETSRKVVKLIDKRR